MNPCYQKATAMLAALINGAYCKQEVERMIDDVAATAAVEELLSDVEARSGHERPLRLPAPGDESCPA